MLAPELLKQIQHLQLKAGHLANEILAGEYTSAFRGRGMEFHEVREYTPGDDIRWIDWNVTARMNQPFVKQFREERQLTLMLLVDVSPSQNFASVARSKLEVAAELAAILAFLAQRYQDRAGLLLFSDHIEQFIPPKKGRSHVWNIIRNVLTHQGRGQSTDVAGALRYFLQMQKKPCLCFVISDFIAPNYEALLRQAGQRHDMVAVRIVDPREEELPPLGVMAVGDAESGKRYWLDTASPDFRRVWDIKRRERNDAWLELARKSGVDNLILTTDQPVVQPLLKFFRRREGRRRL